MWGADHLIEPVAYTRAGGADFAPDILQGRGGAVGHFILREDRIGNTLLQEFIRHKRLKEMVEAGFHPRAAGAPFREGTDHAQHLGDIKQFTHGQHPARGRALQGVVDIVQPAEGRSAKPGEEHVRILRLLEQGACQMQIRLRRKRQGELLRVRTGGV
jgi:hypothetical protein